MRRIYRWTGKFATRTMVICITTIPRPTSLPGSDLREMVYKMTKFLSPCISLPPQALDPKIFPMKIDIIVRERTAHLLQILVLLSCLHQTGMVLLIHGLVALWLQAMTRAHRRILLNTETGPGHHRRCRSVDVVDATLITMAKPSTVAATLIVQ